MASRSGIVFRTKRRVEGPGEGAGEGGGGFGPAGGGGGQRGFFSVGGHGFGPREGGGGGGGGWGAARWVAKRLFLTLASTVLAQRKAGCRAAVRSEPVTWRSWMIPGCHAMHRNHCPPSLTMVVPAATRAHSRLVSAVWNPRTTCRRAYRGRLSAVVSTAMIKGVWPRRPRPEPSPVRSPPI